MKLICYILVTAKIIENQKSQIHVSIFTFSFVSRTFSFSSYPLNGRLRIVMVLKCTPDLSLILVLSNAFHLPTLKSKETHNPVINSVDKH